MSLFDAWSKDAYSLSPEVDSAIRQAVLAERERCAKIAESIDEATGCNHCDIGEEISAAIRSGE